MGSQRPRLGLGIGIGIALTALGTVAPMASAAPAPFTASSITSPRDDSELFYSGDTGSGSAQVTGTVTPATERM